MRASHFLTILGISLALTPACDGESNPVSDPTPVETPDATTKPDPAPGSKGPLDASESPQGSDSAPSPAGESPIVPEPGAIGDFQAPEPVATETLEASVDPAFVQPTGVPDKLPYMHRPVPDPTVSGWQVAPLNPYPPMIDPQLRDKGFPHVLAAKPRLLANPNWQPWTRGSRIAVTHDLLYVTDPENNRLVALNRATGAVAAATALDSAPTQVVVSPEGRVFVSLLGTGSVVELTADARTIVQKRTVGVEAFGLALTPDGDRLLVTDRAGGRLLLLDVGSDMGEAGVLIEGLDFPGGVVVSQGETVTVLTRGSAVTQATLAGDLVSKLGSVALRTSTPYEAFFLEGRKLITVAGQASGAAINPANGSVLIAHYQRLPGGGGTKEDKAKLGLPAFVSSGYFSVPSTWITSHPHLARPVEGAVTTIDPTGAVSEVDARPVRNPQTLEPVVMGLSVPREIAHHPTLSLAFVAAAGTDSVIMLNTAVVDGMAAPLGVIEVGGGPSGVALSDDGWFAYVVSDQAFAVSEVDLRGLFTLGPPSTNLPTDTDSPFHYAAAVPFGGLESTDTVMIAHGRWAAFGEDPLPEPARLGRRLFTDARNPRITGRERFACESCHPDGGEDQTVWNFPSGPRQTPPLAGRLADTAPYNWNGSRSTLPANFERTIRRMGGVGLQTEELLALEAFFLQGWRVPTNPNLSPDGFTPAQERGKAIFEDPSVGCAGCHIPGPFTDGKVYYLETVTEAETQAHAKQAQVGLADPLSFNTPTLRGLWNSAPYLHNGRARTLREVLDLTAGRMGDTSRLSEADKEDLIEYLEAL
jgi:DNA-binding beta-propeller fold protein YncE/mono/diheme cytochrome c family protein